MKLWFRSAPRPDSNYDASVNTKADQVKQAATQKVESTFDGLVTDGKTTNPVPTMSYKDALKIARKAGVPSAMAAEMGDLNKVFNNQPSDAEPNRLKYKYRGKFLGRLHETLQKDSSVLGLADKEKAVKKAEQQFKAAYSAYVQIKNKNEAVTPDTGGAIDVQGETLAKSAAEEAEAVYGQAVEDYASAEKVKNSLTSRVSTALADVNFVKTLDLHSGEIPANPAPRDIGVEPITGRNIVKMGDDKSPFQNQRGGYKGNIGLSTKFAHKIARVTRPAREEVALRAIQGSDLVVTGAGALFGVVGGILMGAGRLATTGYHWVGSAAEQGLHDVGKKLRDRNYHDLQEASYVHVHGGSTLDIKRPEVDNWLRRVSAKVYFKETHGHTPNSPEELAQWVHTTYNAPLQNGKITDWSSVRKLPQSELEAQYKPEGNRRSIARHEGFDAEKKQKADELRKSYSTPGAKGQAKRSQVAPSRKTGFLGLFKSARAPVSDGNGSDVDEKVESVASDSGELV